MGIQKVGEHKIEILPTDGSTMYLGRLLCINNLHDVELEHRHSGRWAEHIVSVRALGLMQHTGLGM